MDFLSLDLGLVSYSICHDLQKKLRIQRQRGLIPDLLLFVEHPPVLTLGKRFVASDIIDSSHGFPVMATERGGRVTYHGPGQIVGYLICDLRARGLSIPQWVHQTEILLQETLIHWEMKTRIKTSYPGLWTVDGRRKIASLGFHVERNVSMHGFSLNCSCNLDHYRFIHPCGLQDCEMTSMEKELGKNVSMLEVKTKILEVMDPIFRTKINTLNSMSFLDSLCRQSRYDSQDCLEALERSLP